MFVSAGFSQPPLGMASNPNMHLAGGRGEGHRCVFELPHNLARSVGSNM